MRRLFAVIALGAALGLSTTAFTPSNNSNVADTDCDASADLSVTALLEEAETGDGELVGRIFNSSDDNDYDEVMVRVEFLGESTTDTDLYRESETEIETETDTDISDIDIDADVDDADIDVDTDVTRETEVETDIDTDSDLSPAPTDNVLHSQVFTINEDVEAGETEEFELNITPPAGTKMVRTTVVCAD